MAGKDNDSLDDYLNEVAGLEADNNSMDNGDNDGQQESSVDQTSTNEIDTLNGRTAPPNVQQEGAQQAQQRQPNPNDKPAASTTQVEGLRRYHLGNYLNAQGDIVNEKGEIIAQRGSQRRLHDENATLRRERETERQELDQLRRESRETQFLNNIPRQYGLTNDEVAHGLDLEARIKRGDVVGVAREVTALLAAKGVNISQVLGKDVGDSVDMAAIKAMLDQRLAPIQRQEEQSREQTEATQNARRQYEQFVRDNEYADVHADAIVAYRQKFGVSLQQAYNATRSFIIQNGLDITQPLGPQIEAAQQQQQQRQQPEQRRPMPNGQPTRPDGVQPMKPVYADADDSWGSIISRAIGEQLN